MTERPVISVVIPSYNCAGYLPEALASVLDQDYSPLEVLVVDDGSTDATEAVLAPFSGRIKYIRQENGGVSCARNRGIREATGEWIAFLDADDRWLPGKLTRQWEDLRGRPEAQLVHTNVYLRYEPEGREVIDTRDHGRYSGCCYVQAFWGNAIITSSVMVRKSSLIETGLFDEATRYAEDYDLWLRLARHYAFAYVDEPLVVYREHQTNASRREHAMFEGEYYVLAKTLAADGSLPGLLGARRMRRRLYDSAFSAGYANAERGDLTAARRLFATAWMHAPLSVRAGAMWLSTLLPPAARRALRRLKRALPIGRVPPRAAPSG